MSGREKFSVGCFLPTVVLVLFSYSSCSYYFNNQWKGAVPKDINMGRNLARSTDIMGSPGGSCGGAIFRLKGKTQERILEQGQDFFSDKVNPRAWQNSTIVWQKGSIEAMDTLSFRCVLDASSDSKDYKSKIQTAIKEERAYFGVMKGKAYNTRLLILPEEKLIFVGYWDS